MDPAGAVLCEGLDPTEPGIYTAPPKSGNVPPTTLWYRAHGRPSRQEKVKRQRYLTPSEEKALVGYLLRMSNNGYPLPIKYLRSLALLRLSGSHDRRNNPPSWQELASGLLQTPSRA